MPRIFFVLSVIGGLILPAYAERKYQVGTTMDVTAGGGNQAGSGSLNLERLHEGLTPFYSVYPSIRLRSEGSHSLIDLNYTFSGEYFRMNPALFSASHSVNASFAARLGNRTYLSVSDDFTTMPDYSTISVLKGITPTPQGFQYVFGPQLYKSSGISDSVRIGLDIDLTAKTHLTFGGSGSYRHYDQSVNRSYLSGQWRAEGSFGFLHKQSTRTTWGLKYKYWRNDYKEFAASRSHAATLGWSRMLSPGCNLTLEAGPAYVESDSSVSYVVDLGISKQVRTNHFSAGYSHHAGDSTGFGGASNSHQGYSGFSKSIGRTVAINFQANAFRQSGSGNVSYNYWGAGGSAAISKQVGKYWVTSIGGSYRTNMGGGYDEYAHKRAYVAIGYRLPDLWRMER